MGQDPAGRILAGAVRLGDIEAVHAAMLLADLRDFSGLSDALAPQAVLPLLNGYLDCVVPAAQAHGGEVLKFVGDGVLAAFRTGAAAPG